MGRRRLRLRLPSDDDDEEEDEEQRQQHLQTLILTRPGANPTPPAPPQPQSGDAPLEISDDDEDFADVPDAFSTPSPPPPPPEPSSADGAHGGSSAAARAGVEGGGESPSGPVGGFLRMLGLRLRRDWLESCLACLSSSHLGFEYLDDAGKAKLCFEQFLFSDMNSCGDGGLPENVGGMHGVALEGPYVLQVDEIVNISSPLRARYYDAPAGSKRCLKLSMTDGVQHVYGMEYRPISQLKVLASAGLKIAIRNVHIRRGLLMLVPEVIEVLGGLVEDLEAARERLVYEVNKPPRGKRKQPTLPLSERASLAAWPSSSTSDIGPANLPVSHDGGFPQMVHQVNFATSRRGGGVDPMEGFDSDPRTAGSTLEQSGAVHTSRTAEQLPASCTTRGIEDVSLHRNITEDLSAQRGGHTEEFSVPCTGRGSTGQLAVRDTLGSVTKQSAIRQSGECCIEEGTGAQSSVDSELHASSNSGLGAGDTDMVDTLEHPLLLSGEREIPFTYLACLLAKWAAKDDSLSSIQGKIKILFFGLQLQKYPLRTLVACTLSCTNPKSTSQATLIVNGKVLNRGGHLAVNKGVKGFQFKQRSTYELRVYVDDGSLISEVLVDHHVVEKGIGYCPKEVTAALSSSDKTTSSNMREAMKRFQLFLTKFEGTMLVEINKEQTTPVALEMNQGYSTSDAWLLLRRVKMLTASLTPRQQSFNIIDVSP